LSKKKTSLLVFFYVIKNNKIKYCKKHFSIIIKRNKICGGKMRILIFVENIIQFTYDYYGYVILSFLFYSFIGWLWESLICSYINKGHFVNRGYLYGPICPIYGCGAVINIFLFSKFEIQFLIFLMTAVSSTIIEYLTSYVLELLFHARWWDYTDMPMNLNGRVCLYGFLLFGLGNVMIVSYVNPILMKILCNFYFRNTLSIILFSMFIIDVIISTIELNSLKEKLENIKSNIVLLLKNNEINTIFNHIEISINKKMIIVKVKNFKERIMNNELRFFKAFPNIKINKSDHILVKIVEKLKEIK